MPDFPQPDVAERARTFHRLATTMLLSAAHVIGILLILDIAFR